jgi:ABC-type transporter Mla MlaB component
MAIEFLISSEDGTIHAAGEADSTANFSEGFAKAIASGTVASIDLGGIKKMNSKGVSRWLEFVAKAQATTSKLKLRRVPVCMIQYMSQIKGFLPANAIVESFFVPYFDPDQGVSENVLFKRGLHFDDQNVYLTAVTRSETSGTRLETDFHRSSYFKFLGDVSIVSK